MAPQWNHICDISHEGSYRNFYENFNLAYLKFYHENHLKFCSMPSYFPNLPLLNQADYTNSRPLSVMNRQKNGGIKTVFQSYLQFLLVNWEVTGFDVE